MRQRFEIVTVAHPYCHKMTPVCSPDCGKFGWVGCLRSRDVLGLENRPIKKIQGDTHRDDTGLSEPYLTSFEEQGFESR
jgi:hypothetical protein